MDEAEVIEALAAGVGSLAADKRATAAQALAQFLLAIDSQEARNAFGRAVERLAPVESPELSGAMLSHVSRRSTQEWPRWLDAISDGTLERIARGSALATEAVERLWQRGIVPDDEGEGGALASALASLARVAASTGVDEAAIGEQIRIGIGGPATDEAAAEVQEQRIALAYDLSSVELVDVSTFSATTLEAISGSLDINILNVGTDGALAKTIMIWAPRLAADANPDSRSRYREALENSPWCPSPVRECGILCAASVIKEADGEDRNPYSADTVAALSQEYGDAIAAGLSAFVGTFADSRAEIATAIAPSVGRDLPDDVRDALAARVEEWESLKRSEFVAGFIADAFSVMPSRSFLDAAGYRESVADSQAIVALVDLYGSAGNPGERAAVLELWRALGPTDDSLRRRLINDIAIPMAHQGKGALDLVIANLDLTSPAPRGTVQNLRSTLRDRAKGKDQKQRVDAALLDAGLIKKSGLFGRGRKDIWDARSATPLKRLRVSQNIQRGPSKTPTTAATRSAASACMPGVPRGRRVGP